MAGKRCDIKSNGKTKARGRLQWQCANKALKIDGGNAPAFHGKASGRRNLALSLGGKNMSIPLSEWSGSGATRELHETIKLQIKAMDKNSRVTAKLTWVMLFLAFIQTVATIIQIVLVIQDYQDRHTQIDYRQPTKQLKKQ